MPLFRPTAVPPFAIRNNSKPLLIAYVFSHPFSLATGGGIEGEGVEGGLQAGHQHPGGRITAYWMD